MKNDGRDWTDRVGKGFEVVVKWMRNGGICGEIHRGVECLEDIG
jgi:hypothetical protein